MHGGSLRVAASALGPPSRRASIVRARGVGGEQRLNDSATWDGFGARLPATHRRVRRHHAPALADGATIWAYGAAGKATMWVNACDMDYLEAVVDASPLRAGKLMPGTHTPIVSPDEFKQASPDYVFVTAWNYLDAIRGNEPQYEGYWIVPLPEMRIQ